jgi:hypothetical protein
MADGTLDTNVIMGAQPVQMGNPLDMATKALTLRDLSQRSQIQGLQAQQAQQQFNDEQTLRTAKNNNTKVNPDGSIALDKGGLLKDLANSQNPSLAVTANQQLTAQQNELQNNQMASTVKRMEFVGQIASTVHDQKSLDQGHAALQSAGIDTSQFPTIWDQRETPGLISQVSQNALTVQQKAENAIKQQGQNIENKKLDVDLYKTFGNPMTGGQAVAASPNTDPASLVPKHIPPDRQAKALDEIDAAQNTSRNAPKILQAFDNAANNLHATDFVPGTLNADQKAMHALLGPTFKDVEGTVRQAAMDNMYKNTTPAFGDDAQTTATKRAALAAYLQSKASAPTAKAFGIDLTKYKSTSIDQNLLAGKQSSGNISHSKMAIGTVSNGMVKTAAGWVPAGQEESASK